MTRQFNIENLLEEQQKSLREFLGGHCIFVNLPRGFGKSLIFQFLPIAAVALFARPQGSSVVVWWDVTYGVLKIPSLICATTCTSVLKFL